MTKNADVVVIGGSAAGPTAGISCRRRYPEKKVLLVRQEEQVLVPCGIPYIYGTVGSPQKNLIPDALLSKNDIELVKGEATEIDREKNTVRTDGGDEISYDKLVMATGSLPMELPIPGLDKENVFFVKKDVDYLQCVLDTMKNVKDVVIIGGGFIGVEFADECRKYLEGTGGSVTIVEVLPHCLQLALDEEYCQEAEDVLTQNGVQVLTNKKVEAVLGDSKVSGVKLASGEELKADMVIVGVGARPNTELAGKAGLELGPTKAIRVDRYMRTLTDANIFACGDCAEKFSFFSGKLSRLMLASIATSEARIAGANLFNTCFTNCGAVGVFSTKLGERAFGCAGMSEVAAKKEGLDIVTGVAAGANRHPGGMPGMAEIKLKLVFCRENGLMIGGSASGDSTVGELLNVMGACIQHRVTANDLALFQMGTHPALTASPIAYQIVNAAELAIKAMR